MKYVDEPISQHLMGYMKTDYDKWKLVYGCMSTPAVRKNLGFVLAHVKCKLINNLAFAICKDKVPVL
jgi:hypothetical protein